MLHVGNLVGLERTDIQFGQFATTGEHIFHVRHVDGIEVAEVQLFQTGTILEHAAHIRHVLGVERAQIELFKRGTPCEHFVHIRHLVGVKRAQIEFSQSRTAVEHSAHVLHLLGVERTQVEFGEAGAGIEHAAHIRHVEGVEVLHTGDLREVVQAIIVAHSVNRLLAAVEHVFGGSQLGFRHGGVYDSFCYQCAVVLEADCIGVVDGVIEHDDTCAVVILVVVVIGERIGVGVVLGIYLRFCRLSHIGYQTYRLTEIEGAVFGRIIA